jgi:hypothetical protein
MALAAVLDPVEKNSAVVFYYSQINSNYNLAMRLFSLTGGSDSKYTDFNTANSSATPSSALAAATFLGDVGFLLPFSELLLMVIDPRLWSGKRPQGLNKPGDQSGCDHTTESCV